MCGLAGEGRHQALHQGDHRGYAGRDAVAWREATGGPATPSPAGLGSTTAASPTTSRSTESARRPAGLRQLRRHPLCPSSPPQRCLTCIRHLKCTTRNKRIWRRLGCLLRFWRNGPAHSARCRQGQPWDIARAEAAIRLRPDSSENDAWPDHHGR